MAKGCVIQSKKGSGHPLISEYVLLKSHIVRSPSTYTFTWPDDKSPFLRNPLVQVIAQKMLSGIRNRNQIFKFV